MLARDIAPGIRLPSEPTPKAFGGSQFSRWFLDPKQK